MSLQIGVLSESYTELVESKGRKLSLKRINGQEIPFLYTSQGRGQRIGTGLYGLEEEFKVRKVKMAGKSGLPPCKKEDALPPGEEF